MTTDVLYWLLSLSNFKYKLFILEVTNQFGILLSGHHTHLWYIEYISKMFRYCWEKNERAVYLKSCDARGNRNLALYCISVVILRVHSIFLCKNIYRKYCFHYITHDLLSKESLLMVLNMMEQRNLLLYQDKGQFNFSQKNNGILEQLSNV